LAFYLGNSTGRRTDGGARPAIAAYLDGRTSMLVTLTLTLKAS